MKAKLLLLLISISSSYTYTAQFCPGQYKEQLSFGAGLSYTTIVVPRQNNRFTKLPIGGNHDIIFLICASYDNLKDTAKTINALAQTNKFLNKFINDDDRSLKLIKNLSLQFNCSHMEVTQKLNTIAAKKRWLIQDSFICKWISNPISDFAYNFSGNIKELTREVELSRPGDFSRLHTMGLDLEFTYSNKNTALLMSVAEQKVGYADVGKWLIKNGANINAVDSCGRNVCMIALYSYNTELIPLLLTHNALRIHYQDKENNTLLHHYVRKASCRTAFYGVLELDLKRYEYMLKVIEQLLKKGANPTVQNKDGKTVLDLAREIKYQPMIDLLESSC